MVVDLDFLRNLLLKRFEGTRITNLKTHRSDERFVLKMFTWRESQDLVPNRLIPVTRFRQDGEQNHLFQHNLESEWLFKSVTDTDKTRCSRVTSSTLSRYTENLDL